MSLTLAEARARAAQLFDVSYGVELDLTEPASGAFGCRSTVRFASTEAETFLELSGARDLRVLVGGHLAPGVVRRLHGVSGGSRCHG